ncbi:hypothetical protein Nepgr_009249 [Nepenthes gracilis]|uniref:Uncharacterized protein n=1 Tax=Nepenthes gracilis TaxID=150966 RepID=A0AAD3XK23_NEPGR|nr:hypothetical protein Nepgr_009249 [Nepenthes gracilis]
MRFLGVERRAASKCRRNWIPYADLLGKISLAQLVTEANSSIDNDQVAYSQSSPWSGSDIRSNHRSCFDNGDGFRIPVLFSCICGQTSR